jgi:hypothetical protein
MGCVIRFMTIRRPWCRLASRRTDQRDDAAHHAARLRRRTAASTDTTQRQTGRRYVSAWQSHRQHAPSRRGGHSSPRPGSPTLHGSIVFRRRRVEDLLLYEQSSIVDRLRRWAMDVPARRQADRSTADQGVRREGQRRTAPTCEISRCAGDGPAGTSGCELTPQAATSCQEHGLFDHKERAYLLP